MNKEFKQKTAKIISPKPPLPRNRTEVHDFPTLQNFFLPFSFFNQVEEVEKKRGRKKKKL